MFRSIFRHPLLHIRTRSSAAGLCALLLLVACSKTTTTTEETTVSAVVPVRAATIVSGPIQTKLTVSGHTEALNRQKIVTPIAGKILSLNAIEGSYVKAGQVLAVIQSKEAQASEEGAKIMTSTAHTAEEIAQAKRMQEAAKHDQNGVEVRAQISGLIASRSANPGEFVTENTELFGIIDESEIDFVAQVPLYDLNLVRIGQYGTVTLPSLPNGQLSARVIAIKPQADSMSQSALVVLRFDRKPATMISAFRTGIVGTADLITDTRVHTLLVPKSAVLRNDEANTYTIVTFGKDSLARSLEVEVGGKTDSMIEIRGNDVHEGMNVIVEGNYALADSVRITLSSATQAATESDEGSGKDSSSNKKTE